MGHLIEENKRQRQVDEAEKAKRREERLQKKEDELKAQENQKTNAAEDADKKEVSEAPPPAPAPPPEALMTDRQREGIQAQKDKEEREIRNRVAELANKFGPQCLGRDRAYRRYWKLE